MLTSPEGTRPLPERSRRSPRRRVGVLAIALTVALAAAGCSDDGEASPSGGSDQSAPATDGGDDSGSGNEDDQPTAGQGGSDTIGEELGCPDAAAVGEVIGAEVSADHIDDFCGYYGAGDESVGIGIEDPTTRTVEDIERNIVNEPIDGVGDAAYATEQVGGPVQVGVFEGDRHILVTITGVDGATNDDGLAVYQLFAG